MRELGFDRMELVVPGGERFDAWLHDQDENPRMADCWALKIPFGPPLEEGWLEVSRHVDRGEGYLMLHGVVQIVREVFPQKILRQPPVRSESLQSAEPVPISAGSEATGLSG